MTTPKNVFTRKEFQCPLFGNPADLSTNKLPNYEDVMKCYNQVRYDLSLEINNKKVAFSNIARIVARKIILLFEKASIPPLSERRVVAMIKTYHDKYYQIRKSYLRDQTKESFKQKLEAFKRSSTFLFDVAACKCPIVIECTCKKNPDMCVCMSNHYKVQM